MLYWRNPAFNPVSNPSLNALFSLISGFVCLCILCLYTLNFYLLIDNIELAALIILPALLPDPRCKMDTSRIVYMAKVNRKCLG